MPKDAPEQSEQNKDAPKKPRRKKDAPKDEDRQAVGMAVTERMHQLGLTVAEINRRTGLSETTIYAVIQVTGQPTKSTLALLSAVLDWRINHLYNILQGRAHENVVTESPLEKNLAQLVRGLADIDTLRGDVSELKGDVSELKDVVHRIDGKVDVVIASRHASSGDVR
ncbi:MAG: helix-turn-helix transcriptional regulator [Streptosporangiaceae bacterium]|nr:helix-turn-helix transcriptional regulator [Streptosporangiaceae bacterium]MBV9858337.1 helix-turn-helix transcriptional regulator [Streptosporangiaceae bacterium]